MKNLVISFFLVVFITNAQQKYSIEALTGRGDIEFCGDNFKLQKEVYNAFMKMKNKAKKEGIDIEIVSSYRSFEHQKSIWNRKYKAFTNEGLTPMEAMKKIIEYSTIPGTSRHHWGTDIDIIDGNEKAPEYVLVEDNFNEGGVYRKLKKWMDKNSEKFGFYLVYTKTKDRKGFKYEPWHYSFRKISKPMLNEYLNVNFKELLGEDIEGFEYMTDKFLESYKTENILDINKVLKK